MSQFSKLALAIDQTHPEFIESVRKFMPPGLKVYLVGGVVRDAMLGHTSHDMDFAVAGDARKLARQVADDLYGSYMSLDDERDAGRVVLNWQNTHFLLDFTALRASDLEGDLRGRDFTINALAFDVNDLQTLIDPLQGLQDMEKKCLRACSPTSLDDDPLRVMRGVRMANWLGYQIEPETDVLIRAAVSDLIYVSAERVRDEFFRILDGSHVSRALRMLDSYGILQVLFPELMALKGVHQTEPHVMDVWEHTLAAVEAMETVYVTLVSGDDLSLASRSPALLSAVESLGRFKGGLQSLYQTRLNPDRSIRSLLMLAALYHDAGKPAAASADDDGRVHFYNHEESVLGVVRERAQSLVLSNNEIARLMQLVGGHMRVHHLSKPEGEVTPRAIYRYFRQLGTTGVDVALFSLADVLAIYAAEVPEDRWQAELFTVQRLLQAWFEQPEKTVRPPRLITGYDIQQEFNLQPGPVIGQLLDFVQEAQVEGELSTREEALDWVRAWLEKFTRRPGGTG